MQNFDGRRSHPKAAMAMENGHSDLTVEMRVNSPTVGDEIRAVFFRMRNSISFYTFMKDG